MALWIARLWFAAATVLFVVAAMYPMRFLRVLNYGHDQELHAEGLTGGWVRGEPGVAGL